MAYLVFIMDENIQWLESKVYIMKKVINYIEPVLGFLQYTRLHMV